VLSECGKYRYRLDRVWDESLPRLGWIMLNPSTADGLADDPTIRRCINYARLHGFGGIVVVNLFAFRSTDPAKIEFVRGIDRENELHWEQVARLCGKVVGAWGKRGFRTIEAQRAIECFRDLDCLGVTSCREPRHPHYIANVQELIPFARAGIREEAYRRG